MTAADGSNPLQQRGNLREKGPVRKAVDALFKEELHVWIGMVEADTPRAFGAREKASPRFGGRTGAQGGGWVEKLGRVGLRPRALARKRAFWKSVLYIIGLRGRP